MTALNAVPNEFRQMVSRLNSRWDELGRTWKDDRQREFEREFVYAFERGAVAHGDELDRLAQTVARIHRTVGS